MSRVTTGASGEGMVVPRGEPQPAQDGVAMAGVACTPEAGRACTGTESSGTLVCEAGVWTVGPVCSATHRCDTREGDTLGTCQPMLSLCTGKKTGDPVCDGYTRRRCGNDLLRFDEFACPPNSHCEGTVVVKCVCDLNYRDDGTGHCTSDVVCPPTACRPGGECVVGATDYSCECGPDYDGTGTKSCVITGRCAESNVCSEEYICRNRDESYVCRGQFADWPMPSTMVGAKVPPSYMFTTDTVADVVTGLTWERAIPGVIPGCNTTCTWDSAKSYCDALELEGMKDWRLPTRIELVSILDDAATMPAIDAEAFPDTPPESFWTASTYAGQNNQAWVVWFGVAQSTPLPKNSTHRVRCVR